MSLPGLELPTLSFAPEADPPAPNLLTVDLDHLITSRLLIQGSSGAGKGWAIRTLLEQTHGRVQQLVLDKEGEFSTLREKYDYILAGAEGDVPATPHTARLLCRQLMDLGASAVLDLYDLSLPDRQKFVRLFLEELMSLPKELWRPLLVVIDEAHFFCPEGTTTEASAAVISLCAEGRKRGFSAVLATQRLSKLSKDAAAELRNKMIGLTSLDVDVRRAADDLGFNRDQAARLKELDPGQFFCVGPAIAKKVVLARTGDVLTTHPKAGQIAAYTPPPPAEAVRALLEQLKGLAEEAEAEVRAEQEKADRTEALTRQVESLQRQLQETSSADQGKASERVVEVERIVEKIVEKIVEVERFVEVPALVPGQVEDLREIADTLMAGSKDMVGMAQEILARVALVQRPDLAIKTDPAIKATPDAEQPVKEIAPKDRPAKNSDMPAKRENSGTSAGNADVVGTSSAAGPTRPQQAILNALLRLSRSGMAQPLREHVALFAGASAKSSGYGNNLGALRSGGFVDYPAPGRLSLTAQGEAHADGTGTPLTQEAVQEAWLSRLPRPQAELARHLIACYPRPMTRQMLAGYADVSATSSGYGNNLGALKSWGLVCYPAAGQVAATDLLFPEGLPE